MIALFDRKLKFLSGFKQEARAATLTRTKRTAESYSVYAINKNTYILSFSLCADNHQEGNR